MLPVKNLLRSHSKSVIVVLLAAAAATTVQASVKTSSADAKLAETIKSDQSLAKVRGMAIELLKGGFNAGTTYNEVWIRDLNTFIEVAIEANSPERIRGSLLPFFQFQGDGGDIADGYVPIANANVPYAYRRSPLAPTMEAHKNTVVTDQESSLVQAVSKYIHATGDKTILDESIGGQTVRERLGRALNYVATERFDKAHGLVWGATRADWGDLQPETGWAMVIDSNSHRALGVYDNAMFLIALNDYIEMIGASSPEADRWKTMRDELRRNIRKYLWDSKNQKFIPHVYLNGSPFKDFDENAIYYHGGTAVAIEAGLLSKKEVLKALDHMEMDVREAGASSIGLTMYPPYPAGAFVNSGMVPYNYQNGGDWCWFGGRMIHQLIRFGYVAEAYRDLQPMTNRVLTHGGFNEWWSRNNEPKGSDAFRGSAGVLGRDVELLQDWAKHH